MLQRLEALAAARAARDAAALREEVRRREDAEKARALEGVYFLVSIKNQRNNLIVLLVANIWLQSDKL